MIGNYYKIRILGTFRKSELYIEYKKNKKSLYIYLQDSIAYILFRNRSYVY